MKNILTAIVIGIALAGISYAQAAARELDFELYPTSAVGNSVKI